MYYARPCRCTVNRTKFPAPQELMFQNKCIDNKKFTNATEATSCVQREEQPSRAGGQSQRRSVIFSALVNTVLSEKIFLTVWEFH